MPAFGHEFILISDTVVDLDPKVFWGGPWTHVATVRRGFKEYMAFVKSGTNKVWVEEVDKKEPGIFKLIKDDNEWFDVVMFLKDAKILEVGQRKEIVLASGVM